ncbi:unnamed protein product [Urochloa decumbens]|uniref:CMP/dCMP-type deaminase domain-containing protein n=1 Tax=Urochloa decumbens TaxID=240449 RepID=A0ABC9FNT5_9POAL
MLTRTVSAPRCHSPQKGPNNISSLLQVLGLLGVRCHSLQPDRATRQRPNNQHITGVTRPSSSSLSPLRCAHVAGGNLGFGLSAHAVHGGAAPGDYKLMKKAVDEAYRAVDSGDGGPFGAVIVRDGAVAVSCHNLVLKNTDPSAHAEVTAIRQACKRLGKLDLSDCEIFTSCEPCAMCLGLIRASKIKKVVYGAKAEAAVAAGFNASVPDAFVEYYRKSGIEIRQVEGEAAWIAEKVFEKAWEIPDEAMRRRRTGGAWFGKAKGMAKCSRFCCLWN